MFGKLPSHLLEVQDWSVAREIDHVAAIYLYEEETKREIEREQRDREFWIAILGGKSKGSDGSESLEETMGESVLGNR